MILYLVRHGESAYNAEGRIQGQVNVPLSALGRRQSAALAAALRDTRIDALFASPLQRAMETARPLADALHLPVQTDDRLMEINAGIFQELTWPEIHARYPQEGERWKSQDPDFVIPDGESRRDLMRRAEAALRAIHETSHDVVLVIAHGGVLTAGLKALLGVPPERNPFMLYNGSISQAEWNSQFRLVTLNQMDHLHRTGDDLRSRTGDL